MSEESLLYQTVGTQVPTKKRLLIAAAKLFTLKGYAATSIDEIAHACNIQKPSFYGHFPSKESIAIATIKDLHDYCEQHLFCIMQDNNLSASERITRFGEHFLMFFEQRPDHALASFLATHTMDNLVGVANAIRDYINAWEIHLQHLILPFVGEQQAKAHALHVQSRLHGAMLLTRIFDDDNLLLQTCQLIRKEWQELVN